jgi:hypothetical protein
MIPHMGNASTSSSTKRQFGGGRRSSAGNVSKCACRVWLRTVSSGLMGFVADIVRCGRCRLAAHWRGRHPISSTDPRRCAGKPSADTRPGVDGSGNPSIHRIFRGELADIASQRTGKVTG